MNIQEENNENQNFLRELGDLIQKAPKGVIYTIQAMEDPEYATNDKLVIIALHGSPRKVSDLLHRTFDKCVDIKQIMNMALETFKLKNTFNPSNQTSLFEAIFGGSPFRKP